MLNGGPTKEGLPFSPSTVARPLTFWLNIAQNWVSPVAALCQRISVVWSVLNLPAPTMLHGSPTKAGLPFSPSTVARLLILLPPINQSWVSLVALLCHRMSLAAPGGVAALARGALPTPTSARAKTAHATQFLCLLVGRAGTASARQREGAS